MNETSDVPAIAPPALPPRRRGSSHSKTTVARPKASSKAHIKFLDQRPPPPSFELTRDFFPPVNINQLTRDQGPLRPNTLAINSLNNNNNGSTLGRNSPQSGIPTVVVENHSAVTNVVYQRDQILSETPIEVPNNRSDPSTPTITPGGIPHSMSAPTLSASGSNGCTRSQQEFFWSSSSNRKPNGDLIDLGPPERPSTGDPVRDLLRLFDPLEVDEEVVESYRNVVEELLPRNRVASPGNDEDTAPAKQPDNQRKTPTTSVPSTSTSTKSVSRTMSVSSPKRKKISDFKIIPKKFRANKELIDFERKMRALRGQYPCNNFNTNPGIVVSPILSSQRDNSLSVKLVISSDFNESPVCFTCNVNTTVEHIVSQVVSVLFEDTTDVDFNSFVLKVCGLEEYLASQSALDEYNYVLECHKFDKDVRLKLIKSEHLNRFYARTSADDIDCDRITPDDLLPHSVMQQFKEVNFKDLNIYLDILQQKVSTLISWVITDGQGNNMTPQALVQNVRQSVKGICSNLGSSQTLLMKEALEDVSQQFLSYSVIKSEMKNKSDTAQRFVVVLENSIVKLYEALYELISLYSEAFPVDFEVSPSCRSSRLEKSAEISLPDCRDGARCYVGSISQVLADWKEQYREFFVLCELWHGEMLLAQNKTPPVYLDKNSPYLFQSLVFNEEIEFGIPVYKLPRETCLYFALIGVEYVSPDSVESKEINKQQRLALTMIKMFDPEEFLVQGSHLLGMWCASEILTRNQFSLNSRCYEPNSPLIIVQVPEYSHKVKFPEISHKPELNNNHSPKKNMHTLDMATQSDIYATLNRNPTLQVERSENALLWERRHYLYEVPSALPKVLKANTAWECDHLLSIYQMVEKWSDLPAVDAMQLLLPAYPDKHIRAKAIDWIRTLGCDELCDFLPQLIQALRFEQYLDSPLIWFFIEQSLKSIRVAHHLYWLFRENIFDPFMGYRCRILLNVMINYLGKAIKSTFQNQDKLLSKLTSVSESIKPVKDTVRLRIMQANLSTVEDMLTPLKNGLCLPLSPSMIIKEIEIGNCSYFTSNTLPLKLVFKQPDHRISDSTVEAMYKIGDDLRQDMLTMQMIRIMDKLWLKEGLNLRIVTFGCVATDDRKGFIHIVKDAETLRVIQTEQGVTGSFNERSITEWLRKHNPSELEYQQAVDNFTQSCAGYAVATYILGICDRHNDNIMITTRGHLFHIDFGKFLGDAQMMGNIKRDRVPFVLTSDMVYVINGGSNSSKNFQEFVELCCSAYNIIRRHTNLFTSLFSLMTSSSIAGVTEESVKYIHQTLQPELSETEAMTQFTRKIEESLKAKSVQFNFLLHNLAQMRFTGDHNDQRLFSFATKTFSKETDGKIHSLEVVGCIKKREPEKQYYHIIKVTRAFQPDPSYILRTYREFCELYQKISDKFKLVYLHPLNRGSGLSRSNTKEVAERRTVEINIFLMRLLDIAEEISHSDLVYTFFHPVLIDQEYQQGGMGAVAMPNKRSPRRESISDGQVKLSIVYKNASLTIMVMHAKNLNNTRTSPPDCYVKMYLNPDPHKVTKRKTKIVSKNHHPTFMEMIVYQMPLELVRQRLLQVAVWEFDRVSGNNYLGAALIPLGEINLLQENLSWYPFTG